MKRRLYSDQCSKFLFICSAVIFILINTSIPTFSAVQPISERWENAQAGTYSPADAIPGFHADIGAWLIGDTVSEFPECGITPHTAKILMWDGSKSLQLNSGNTTQGGCSDNIWAVLFTELHIPGAIDQSISIPITSSTFISFKESGSLVNPQNHGSGSGCLVQPCYDSVSLQVEDINGNVVSYVLQRYPLATPQTQSHYKEIFLNEGAKTYQRNLFDDFSAIPTFNPNSSKIYSVVFAVSEHGSATIDDIVIGPSLSDVILPVITIASPTVDSTYITSSNNLNIGGTASDNIGITEVRWSNDRSGSGIASGTTDWNVNGITLYSGTNIITVTALDAAGNPGIDTLTVTYNPQVDTDGDGYNESVDCNDADNTVYPGAPELCDGKDNDCDGNVDEGFNNEDNDTMADCVDPDDDNDGYSDIDEMAAGGDPLNPDSRIVNIDIEIHTDLNMFSYPATKNGGLTSYELLPILGTSNEIERILVYDKSAGIYKETYYTGSSPAGNNIILKFGDGVLIYSKVNKLISFNAAVSPLNSFVECMPISLTAGINVAAFPCAPADHSVYKLMTDLGGQSHVSNINHYNAITGMFESAIYAHGQPAGHDFNIIAGEAYFIYMKQAVYGIEIK